MNNKDAETKLIEYMLETRLQIARGSTSYESDDGFRMDAEDRAAKLGISKERALQLFEDVVDHIHGYTPSMRRAAIRFNRNNR